MMVKRKLDGAVDESSADQEIHKSDVAVHNWEKFGGLHLTELNLMARRQAGWLPGRPADKIWAMLEIL